MQLDSMSLEGVLCRPPLVDDNDKHGRAVGPQTVNSGVLRACACRQWLYAAQGEIVMHRDNYASCCLSPAVVVQPPCSS